MSEVKNSANIENACSVAKSAEKLQKAEQDYKRAKEAFDNAKKLVDEPGSDAKAEAKFQNLRNVFQLSEENFKTCKLLHDTAQNLHERLEAMHKELDDANEQVDQMQAYQITKLIASASKNETPGGVETALLLTSAQATLLAKVNATSTLKELGLKTNPRIVINLIGDVTGDVVGGDYKRIMTAEEQLLSFMQQVNRFFPNR